MFISIIWILIHFILQQYHQFAISGYIETITISSCESCKLQLTCRHLDSIIAIWIADFQPHLNATSDSNKTTIFPPIHPRQALNKRCSGVNHCSFILTEDCPGADTWGTGTLTVKYACISEDKIWTFCNTEIILASKRHEYLEGFIHNPGYPRFYATERECRWKIIAPSQQHIKITILDIALTADRVIPPKQCTDHLKVIDSGQLVHTTCHQNEPPLEIISKGEQIELVLASMHSLTPLRGVFVYFTAIGCPTPSPPEDGYLIYRNETTAEYRCCVGFIFPDDGLRKRVISCLGSYWDTDLPLPDCQRKKYSQKKRKTINLEMGSEIIAPVLLIVSLFLINFGVLFYIYKKKQENAIIYEDEELGTLQEIKRVNLQKSFSNK